MSEVQTPTIDFKEIEKRISIKQEALDKKVKATTVRHDTTANMTTTSKFPWEKLETEDSETNPDWASGWNFVDRVDQHDPVDPFVPDEPQFGAVNPNDFTVDDDELIGTTREIYDGVEDMKLELIEPLRELFKGILKLV